MAHYVDGFVLVVPKKKLGAYRRMAAMGGRIWRKFGALDYKECVADDMKPKGVVLTFPKLVRLKPGEVVVFSFITYRSRAHRDAVNAKVMKAMDEYMKKRGKMEMPFDMKRMAYGGFKTIVDMAKR